MEKKNLPWVTKISYGVGHVFNDLCASMWFSYLLLFYQNVLKFSNTSAGLILLVGQVADGISTPIVGIFSDKENKIPICARYGRRKTWHLLGTVLCFLSFPFIFNECLGCQDTDEWGKFGYYFIFVVIFQFGWACVQISHLALIPDLTTRKCQRTELNSIRYAFTVLANLSVFTITFFTLNAGNNGSDQITGGDSLDNDNDTFWNTSSTFSTSDPYSTATGEPSTVNYIGPEDAESFRNIALICCGIGVVFSLLFHIGVKEPAFIPYKKRCELPPSCGGEKKPPPTPAKMRKMDWFKELPFYQIAVLYMATRLYVNLYQAYIPLYVQDTLKLDQTFLALVPFAMYLAGFIGSLLMKEINKKIGRKRTFALGCCVGIAGCIWLWFGKGEYYSEWGIFLVGGLLGIGGSTLLITSLSITADLIGENVEGGAFVYGFMSLVDKFSNGIIIMIIQEFNPEEPWYYRSVITFACGSACALGIAVVISLMNVRVGQSRTRDVALSIFEDSETSAEATEKCGFDNPGLSALSEVSVQSIPPATVNGTCCKDSLSQNSPSITKSTTTETPPKCNKALSVLSEVSMQSIPPATVNGTCCKDSLPKNSPSITKSTTTETPPKCNKALSVLSEVSMQSIPPATVNGTCCKDSLPQNSPSLTKPTTKDTPPKCNKALSALNEVSMQSIPPATVNGTCCKDSLPKNSTFKTQEKTKY